MPGTSLLSSRRDRQFRRTNAREIVARPDDMGVEWRAELEDRDGSLFATAIDPDGNYVQIIQLSDELRATMETS
jgi:hypothetical protein